MDLYLTGLTAVLMASKLEDPRPIFMRQLLRDAGHHRFSWTDVQIREREILLSLGFRILAPFPFPEANALLLKFLSTHQSCFDELKITQENTTSSLRKAALVAVFEVDNVWE